MKTLLENFFTNNGTYFNPSQVSAVYILPDATTGPASGLTHGSPDIYINREIGTPTYGRLNAQGLSSVAASFNISNGDAIQNPSAYSGAGTSGASAIYSGLSGTAGHYQIVLDQTAHTNFSAVGKYFDAWLVKDFSSVEASAGWQLYWNKFEVFSDRIVTFTEPYQVTTHNKLSQKYLQLSSISDLRITTDVFLANRNMTQDQKDIWREQVIDNAQIRIRRRNPKTSGLITDIVDWTGSGVEITSENTIMYPWDTSLMETGDYVVQAKYTLLTQTFVTEEFSLVLR
tara:strand:- start:1662 stop:2519 length:858 start_codon:yes stop_codon:yes gene_type:complete